MSDILKDKVDTLLLEVDKYLSESIDKSVIENATEKVKEIKNKTHVSMSDLAEILKIYRHVVIPASIRAEVIKIKSIANMAEDN